MKKAFFTLIIAIAATNIYAQTIINDSVSIGAGYANQIWYSLQNDEQGTSPKNNWDIAFATDGYGSSIFINSVAGTKLWLYPNGDTSTWATLDTMGLSTWTGLSNSDTSWAVGAFDGTMDASNQFDLGWGVYNMVNHFVVGDSLYVVKLADDSYHKLWILQLGSGTYTFRTADLDGSNERTDSLVKADFAGKNFGYFSLQNHATVDREPLASDWDLTFTQYTALLPGQGPYTVTGALTNNNVTVAKAAGVDTSIIDYDTLAFSSLINAIGYDWKSYNGSGYAVTDSLVYFVKDVNDSMWKVIFTGFSGSSTGTFNFSKEKLATVVVPTGIDQSASRQSSLSVYPNPAINQTTVLYDLADATSAATLRVFDLAGKQVFADVLGTANGLQQYQLPLGGLQAGMYVVTVETNGYRLQQKLMVQ